MKPGEQGLVFFPWTVPDPALYCGIFPTLESDDFSLLARIISDDDPMAQTETTNVWTNAKNNNNIAWKNIKIVSGPSFSMQTNGITISNLSSESKNYSLEFKIDDNIIGTAIFEEAEIAIELDDELYQKWTDNGSICQNIDSSNQKFIVSDDLAIFDNITLESNEIRTLNISFNFLSDELTEKKDFYYHFIQRDKVTEDIVGGKTFHIIKGPSDSFEANAGNDKEIEKYESVTLSAEDINEPAIYNWYDPDGNLIFTGIDITVSPDLTQEYTLEVIKESDGFKDYDQVEVEVNPFVLGNMAPNPSNDTVTIEYIAEDASSAYLILTELNTNNTFNHILNTTSLQTNIDVSSYSTGLYFVTLVCNGNSIDTITLIVE